MNNILAKIGRTNELFVGSEVKLESNLLISYMDMVIRLYQENCISRMVKVAVYD